MHKLLINSCMYVTDKNVTNERRWKSRIPSFVPSYLRNFSCKIGDGEKSGDMADACAHGNVGCARTLAESGIILWHHRLV